MSPPVSPAPRARDSRRSLRRAAVVWGIFVLSATTVASFLQLSQIRSASGNADRTLATPAQPQAGSQTEVLAVSAPRIAPRDAALDRQRWTAIVIHHSGSPAGDAASIERRHVEAGLAGLGYHFVIGNGQGLEDGQVVAGYRWDRQYAGAHVAPCSAAERAVLLAAAPRGTLPDAAALNEHAVAICLVGNGDRRPFTARQLRETLALVRTLQAELGIRSEAVFLHGEVEPGGGPGEYFPAQELRRALLP